MKFSKLTSEERKVWDNEMCKVRQRLRVGFTKNFTLLEKELIDYMESYESLQNKKRSIYDKYLKETK